MVTAATTELEDMFERMETDTLQLAKYMETLLLQNDKCSAENIQKCSEANYDGCVSEFPSMDCPGEDFSYPIGQCGSSKEGGCGGFFDFTVSQVTLAPSIRTDLGDEEANVKDTVCWTLLAEQEMIDVSSSSKDYWNKYSVSSPALFFGADNGVFRQYPASGDTCENDNSSYDPRVRPWYVAASSGPKDIILVLDTSGSMGTEFRIDKLKLAAKRVISTLGISDYFSVVSFNSEASKLGTKDLLLTRATDDNKNDALKYIDTLIPSGGTIYNSGFQKAFDIFSESNLNEISSGCRQAILFVTDGSMQDIESTLYQNIDRERAQYSNEPPAIFTYSFGGSAPEDVPKNLACRYGGVWSRISDEENLADSMGAYYKYFSYGLGGDSTSDSTFVAWVSPYISATGGSLVTTASAPVYDRSVDPPVLAGVVGFDFTLAAMERALGKENKESRDIIIEDIVRKSVAKCPNFSLSSCQLESLRMYGTDASGFSEATCGGTACDSQGNIPSLTSPTCSAADLNSVGLWENVKHSMWSFEERVCCNVGESRLASASLSLTEVQDQICKEGSGMVAIIGGAVAGVAALIVIIAVVWVCKKKSAASPAKTNLGGVFPETEQVVAEHAEAEHVVYAEQSFQHHPVEAAAASAPPLPPPIAPSAYAYK